MDRLEWENSSNAQNLISVKEKIDKFGYIKI